MIFGIHLQSTRPIEVKPNQPNKSTHSQASVKIVLFFCVLVEILVVYFNKLFVEWGSKLEPFIRTFSIRVLAKS